MKKYFIVENNQQDGPFSKDELRMKGISPSTLVWFEGMANWEQASAISELNELFTTAAPPPPYHHDFSSPADNWQPDGGSRQLPGTGKKGGGLIAAAYLLAILGGAGGIVTGAILWMGKENVNGEKYKKYSPATQLHGAFAFFMGIIVWTACVEMFLKS